MYFPKTNFFVLASSLFVLQIAAGLVVPEHRLRTYMEPAVLEYEPKDDNTTVSINFRRDSLTPTRPSFVHPTEASIPIGQQEVRCGSHIYSTDYIKRTLDTITNITSANKTLGNSGFPQPLGNEGRMMVFPLLRTDEIYDGSEDKIIGPDRIAVGMIGKRRYMVFTIERKKSAGLLNIHTCEHLIPRNASITLR